MTKSRRPFFSSWFWGLALALLGATLAVMWWLLHLAAHRPQRQGDGRDPKSYGFALGNFSLDQAALVASGLPRDAIPALENPGAVVASELSTLGRRFLLPSDPVAGVVVGGHARAYPLRVLVFHELVNDSLGDQPILIVHQPLCGLTAVLSRKLPQGTLTFANSGLLWNSCGLVYDRESQSLWFPLAGTAVAGPAASQKLQFLPFTLTTWERWRQQHPETTLVQPDPARLAQYRRDPYSSYLGSDLLRFPVKPVLPAPLRRKTPLLVFNPGAQPLVVVGDIEKDTAVLQLPEPSPSQVELLQVGHPAVLEVRAFGSGEAPPALYTFAFAWFALHPEPGPETWFRL